jgi:hypothetical protein
MARVKIKLIGYDGFEDRGEGKRKRWIFVGRFDTIDEAREAGATKFKPRYSRNV